MTRKSIEALRAWVRPLIPLAILAAIGMAYVLLRSTVESGSPVDVVRDGRLEVAKIAWAACQLVVFSALGWHIVLHALFFYEESEKLPAALTGAIWALLVLVGAVAAWYFFHTNAPIALMVAVMKEAQRYIAGVDGALNAANTLAVVAVGFLAVWSGALLRSGREAAGKAVLAGRFILSLNSSAVMLVVALVNMWVLYQVPAAAAAVPEHAAAYRQAANGVVLAAGICFSTILVLVYLPLLAMLRKRGMVDEAAIAGSLAKSAKTFAPILAPAVSGLIGALPLLLK